MSDFYLENVEQNDFKKIYRAPSTLLRVVSPSNHKTPSTQRKNLCHFDPFGKLRVNSGRNPCFEQGEKSSS